MTDEASTPTEDAPGRPQEPAAVKTSLEATSRVRRLMDLWEAEADKGNILTAEELCRNDTDIIDRVRDQIDSLKAMTRIMTDMTGHESEPSPTLAMTGADTGAASHPTFSAIDRVAAQGLGLLSTSGTSRSSEENPRLIVGRYYLEQYIAQGGHGQVWRAYDPELMRRLAIKLTRPERMKALQPHQKYVEQYRLIEEARKIARFRAPGIVTIFDVGIQDDLAFIACELIEGEDLSKRLKSVKPTFAEAVRLCIEVAEILQLAHEEGFVHRDIKPANILLEKSGRIVISDFGVAATLDDLDRESGQIIGTPCYMAPEQAAGKSEAIGPTTDIYSLGVILYEMITGRLPFEATETRALMAEIVDKAPPPPTSIDPLIPAPLERVCMKALSKRPEDRQKSAVDFANSLRYAALISNIKWEVKS